MKHNNRCLVKAYAHEFVKDIKTNIYSIEHNDLNMTYPNPQIPKAHLNTLLYACMETLQRLGAFKIKMCSKSSSAPSGGRQ